MEQNPADHEHLTSEDVCSYHASCFCITDDFLTGGVSGAQPVLMNYRGINKHPLEMPQSGVGGGCLFTEQIPKRYGDSGLKSDSSRS